MAKLGWFGHFFGIFLPYFFPCRRSIPYSSVFFLQVPRHRAEVMTHFIRVARRLFELNNFHSSYAIFSALNSAPLARLRHTRELLAKRDRVVLEDLGTVFDPENNWQAFREYQESAGFPRIPHIGTVSFGLFFLPGTGFPVRFCSFYWLLLISWNL